MRWVQPLLLVAAAVACDASASQLWCRQDSDCHTYNDVGAKCQQDACVCSADFAHVAPDVALCARGSSAVREVVRVMFPLRTKCPESSSVALALRTAVTAAAGGTEAVSTSVGCSPYGVLADVTLMTEDLSALHALSLEAVTQELQKTEYRVLQDVNMTQPTHVGVRRVWALRCKPVAHAVEMAYRYPYCVVSECEAGFVPGLLDSHCAQEAPVPSPVPSPAPASTPRPSLPVSVRPKEVPNAASPTLSPDDASPTDTVWCRQDSDCAVYGDKSAVCTGSGKCACSSGYSHLANSVTGRTAYTCVRSGVDSPRAVEKLVAVWYAQRCPRGVIGDVEEAMTAVVGGTVGGFDPFSGMACATPGDAVITVRVQASLKRLLTEDLVTPLHEELSKDTYSTTARSLGKATSVHVQWVGRLQCRVDHAARMHYAEHACVVEACDAGYKVSHDARSCEPVDADGGENVTGGDGAGGEGGDDGLSGGAIAGIVCGTVVGVALLVVVACLLMSRASASRNTESNEPHA
eukprot:TRINITY_DN496_c0_g1_i8.p1 TRINITY_DN496_c0_g1~~TRINITY_DN496_c0_g1_i8.p1  ORF type:complete len:541 (+),score=146.67 TRINITY_DN496_c0_g1_i8:65-1624(+)